VDLAGWSVQYASATGTGFFGANVTPLAGVLAPGQYYLVQQAQGAGGTTPLPTPDATGTTAMALGGAKVALVTSTTGLACNGGSMPCSPGDLARIKDLGGVVLTTERQFQPTAVVEPGPAAQAHALELQRARITLDDGSNVQNPVALRHPNGSDFSLSNRFRGGDTLEDVTGVMHFAFDLYRIQPTQGATYMAANPRPAEPEDVGGSLKVAAANVLNYFTTLDTNPGQNNGPNVCGPLANLECRGANSALDWSSRANATRSSPPCRRSRPTSLVCWRSRTTPQTR
jgi:predicted extracellular nuclease